MSQEKYDDMLGSILVNEKSILGFLSTVFGFLARRTDFYYIPEGPHENMGFPPGVAEDLVVKVLRACDPNSITTSGDRKPSDLNNEIMCSTVAHEVEITTDDDENCVIHNDHDYSSSQAQTGLQNLNISTNVETDIPKALDMEIPNTVKSSNISRQKPSPIEKVTSGTAAVTKPKSSYTVDLTPPKLPTQKTSGEAYNGANTEKYSWSQNIMELDVTMPLPESIKSSKDLKVITNTGDISVARKNGEVIVSGTLPWKIKVLDSFWSISEGKLLMHLEKVQERWWDRLFTSEEPIDLDQIDCSRPLDELPQDHIDKVRELQWNQDRKMKGLPTSDEIRNIDILKKAWNAPGSPFMGQEFDPSVLSKNAIDSEK